MKIYQILHYEENLNHNAVPALCMCSFACQQK
jgi:hypothetical protein